MLLKDRSVPSLMRFTCGPGAAAAQIGEARDKLLNSQGPMQLSCPWEFRPTRAALLGTTDPGSVLCRLPKSDGVLNTIMRSVVLYYQRKVPVRTCVVWAHWDNVRVQARSFKHCLLNGAERGSLTQWQMTLVVYRYALALRQTQ